MNSIDSSSEKQPAVQPVEVINGVEVLDTNDWFLQSTIENVISHGVSLGITVIVNGAIISGTLIDGRKYFDKLSKTMKSISKNTDDLSHALGELWEQNKAMYEKPQDAGDEWQAPPVGYIHLEDARFFSPGQPPIPQNEGVLWRGKLSSVDGFHFGVFTAS